MEGEDKDTCEVDTEPGLTKQQKKNKKKREAAKKKKQGGEVAPTEAKPQNSGGVVAPEAKPQNSDAPPPVVSDKREVETTTDDDNFEAELCWCIQQIQLGLQTQKPSKEQMSKSKKLMEQLQSKKTPKPKKRMLMRTNFGNYRDKIEKEKKQLLHIKPAKFVEVNDKVMNKSVFFRKKVNDLPPVSTVEKEQEFRFNFSEPA